MRSDMSKVIVERPRLRFPRKNGSAYPRGHLKGLWAPRMEDAPSRESMGGFYAEKRLNENLQPLVRFLRSRVGRAWDDVHSEIAARISCQSAVQKHVLDHLRDYVEKDVRLEGGLVKCVTRWKGVLESRGGHPAFYVHPNSRVLCLAPPVARKRRPSSGSDPDLWILSQERELHRIDGIWYAIDLAAIPRDPADRARCFDVLTRTSLNRESSDAGGGDNRLWWSGRFAVRKRQLSGRELGRLRLPRSR